MTMQFIFNLIMVFLLLMASGYELCFYYVASSSGIMRLGDHIAYGLWIIVWVMTIGTGIEVIKAYWAATEEEIDPVAEAVGPILLEGGI